MVAFARNLQGSFAWSTAFAYGMSVVGVGIATLLTYYVPPLHEAPTDLYFAVLAVTAWKFGRGPAILVTILSTLAVDYFIIPPVFSILFDIADITRFAIFAFVALLVCYLQDSYRAMAIRLQHANDELEQRVRERTAALATANQSLMIEVRERQATEGRFWNRKQNFAMPWIAPSFRLRKRKCSIAN